MTLRNWYFRFKTYCNSPRTTAACADMENRHLSGRHTQQQLLEEIWGNDSSEESLNNIISQLRKNSGQTNTFISVHTRGKIRMPIGVT